MSLVLEGVLLITEQKLPRRNLAQISSADPRKGRLLLEIVLLGTIRILLQLLVFFGNRPELIGDAFVDSILALIGLC